MSSACPARCFVNLMPNETGKRSMEDEGKVMNTEAKCPFGYDSQTFKLGPFSCMICQALLFQSCKCIPCSHVYCKACISRFEDCPLCGADIENIEADTDTQALVDRFVEGHARIRRSHVNSKEGGEICGSKTVLYEDVSLERGAFLVQQAMRAFLSQNVESAKARLDICAEDLRSQMLAAGITSQLSSQLGAVLGMLGDCCRAVGDSCSAVTCFEESVDFLTKFPSHDMEVMHTLSVSLNKIGDIKYYERDLGAAKSYYLRSLDVRRAAAERHPRVPSQALDVAVSLAKVADVDRNIGNEDEALDRFTEAMQLLQSWPLKFEEPALNQRWLSVLDFIKKQVSSHDADLPPARALLPID